jgi:prepilin-type N-terminal cleavage/methylation domain-containing protein
VSPRRARSAVRCERGFTLIEIAIGMAVLGLGVVMALQVFGGSMRLARNASRMTEAVVHAKALMDSVLWAPELGESVTHGEIGNGFRWQRTIRNAGVEDGAEEDQTDVRLAVISVTVEWDEPNGVKAYTIGTMRVVPNYGE